MRRIAPYGVQFPANAGLMMAVVYVPLLARSYGADSSTIGLLVGTYQAAALVSSLLFGRWADFGNRKAFVAAGTALTGLALAAHVLVHGLPGLFLARALAGLCVGTWPSALVAYYYDRSGKLGRFTGFGSLGWGAGAVAAGAIAVGWLFPVAGGAVRAGVGRRDRGTPEAAGPARPAVLRCAGAPAQLAPVSCVLPAARRGVQHLGGVPRVSCRPRREPVLGRARIRAEPAQPGGVHEPARTGG